MTRPEILDRIAEKNYQVFDGERDINLIGQRGLAPMDPNKFSDTMTACWRVGGKWETRQWWITCDPGRYYLDHPMNKHGCASLAAGQYKNCWKIGLHRGQYRALVQARPVTVHRILDGEIRSTSVGLYGINIHRAHPDRESQFVDRWSAGCQVFGDPKDFQEFLACVSDSMTFTGTSFVSYCLLDPE